MIEQRCRRLANGKLWTPSGAGSDQLVGAPVEFGRNQEAVPVDGGVVLQRIGDRDFDFVATIDPDCGAQITAVIS